MTSKQKTISQVDVQKNFQGYTEVGGNCKQCKYVYRFTKIKLIWCKWPFRWIYQCKFNPKIKFVVSKEASCKMFKNKKQQ